jgi:hypothetical protein
MPIGAEMPIACPHSGYTNRMSLLLGILVLIAVVWIILVIAAHLPLWLLLLLVILAVVAWVPRRRAY